MNSNLHCVFPLYLKVSILQLLTITKLLKFHFPRCQSLFLIKVSMIEKNLNFNVSFQFWSFPVSFHRLFNYFLNSVWFWFCILVFLSRRRIGVLHISQSQPKFWIGLLFSPVPSIFSDVNNDSNTVRAVLPSSNSAIQLSPVVIEVIEPDVVAPVSTENVSNYNAIMMRWKSLDEVLDQIIVWPKKQSSKRKRAVKHMNSVITSEKWIKIMEA